MTAKRVTERRTRLEKNFTAVFSDVVAGMKQQDLATKYQVSQSAVSYFIARNSEALQQAMNEVVDYSRQTAIADKQYRISELDSIYSALKLERETYGLHVVETTTETEGTGENLVTRVIETRDLRRDLVSESRAVLKAAAEELGQLPRPDQNINVKAMMLIREIGGTEVDVS